MLAEIWCIGGLGWSCVVTYSASGFDGMPSQMTAFDIAEELHGSAV